MVLRKFWAAPGRRRTITRDEQWFQQDGATPHTSNNTLLWLRQRFEDRLISRKRDTERVPHSPDLSASPPHPTPTPAPSRVLPLGLFERPSVQRQPPCPWHCRHTCKRLTKLSMTRQWCLGSFGQHRADAGPSLEINNGFSKMGPPLTLPITLYCG